MEGCSPTKTSLAHMCTNSNQQQHTCTTTTRDPSTGAAQQSRPRPHHNRRGTKQAVIMTLGHCTRAKTQRRPASALTGSCHLCTQLLLNHLKQQLSQLHLNSEHIFCESLFRCLFVYLPTWPLGTPWHLPLITPSQNTQFGSRSSQCTSTSRWPMHAVKQPLPPSTAGRFQCAPFCSHRPA